MESLSFQLRSGEHPYNIDFYKFDISILHTITRILDIEEYNDILIIEVNNEIYKQIGEWLLNNHWYQHLHKENQYDLKIDGREIIITKER